MSVILWPRQEVLQLIIPQLGQVGRPLQTNIAKVIIKKLIRFQSIDGKVSCDQWIMVAKDILKWNDYCIQLFWEMLIMAIFYLNKETFERAKDEMSVDLEYIAIFICLHVVEATQKPSSPSVMYDTVWPSMHPQEAQDLVTPKSPLAPLSPSKAARKPFNIIGSPKSPRSPKSSPRSPKRSQLLGNNRQGRTTAQYLHLVRNKVPLILKALAAVDDGSTSDYNLLELLSSRSDDNSTLSTTEYLITKKIVDALGLIICGGHARDQMNTLISSLHPFWSEEMNDISAASTSIKQNISSKSFKDFSNDNNGEFSITFGEFIGWLEAHLSTNELLYPVSLPPNYGLVACSPSSASHCTDETVGSNASNHRDYQSSNNYLPHNNILIDSHTRAQVPLRMFTPASTLTRFSPTVINSCTTTVIHIITYGASSRSHQKKWSKDTPPSMSTEGNMNILGQGIVQMDISGEMSSRNSFSNSLTEVFNKEFNSEAKLHFMDSKRLLSSLDNEDAEDGVLGGPMRTSHSSDDISICFDILNSRSEHGWNVPQSPPVDLHSNQSDTHKASIINEVISIANKMTSRPDLNLPQLFINWSEKATVYLISPFYSASINGSSDCTIVVGAVHGVVLVSNCERIKLTCACRKLVVINCLDCEFNVATLHPTVIAGDTRSLVFGPYNTGYKSLATHLKMTGLDGLLTPSSNSGQSDSFSGNIRAMNLMTIPKPVTMMASNSFWSVLCDVNACIEAPTTSNSPAGYALDAAANMTMSNPSYYMLPNPHNSTATIIPVDKFNMLSIPYRPEFLSVEFCPVMIPLEYIDSWKMQRDNVLKLKNQLSQLIADSNHLKANSRYQANSENLQNKKDGLQAKVAASTMISKKFMVQYEKIQQCWSTYDMDDRNG